MERPAMMFSLTFAKTPVPGAVVVYSWETSTIPMSAVVPGRNSIAPTSPSSIEKSTVTTELPDAWLTFLPESRL